MSEYLTATEIKAIAQLVRRTEGDYRSASTQHVAKWELDAWASIIRKLAPVTEPA